METSGVYFAQISNRVKGSTMSQENEVEQDENGMTDALSAVAIILIPVISIIYWLSGMPTS
jgi:hypothetical protein